MTTWSRSPASSAGHGRARNTSGIRASALWEATCRYSLASRGATLFTIFASTVSLLGVPSLVFGRWSPVLCPFFSCFVLLLFLLFTLGWCGVSYSSTGLK